MALSQVQFVLSHLRVKFRKLLVDSRRVQKILAHIVAICKQRHGSTSGTKLQFIAEMIDSLSGMYNTSWYLASLMSV